ncbi:MAG: hypothetical protein LBJ65_34020 [Burkholderia sp.]|uniref:hypothetical protein n=1 Tax=Burkholderia sp. TaxID=36773 RepID=UPI002835D95F|nr:hypothetical protein [Burkholderia sp.]MDR0246638.1 hypothetical protein [Burkholderia sp.]
MLRRVVKDHSDIKNPAMMRWAASVWHLKESGIIRARCALSAMLRRVFYFPRITWKPFVHWCGTWKAFRPTGFFFHFYYSRPINTARRHSRIAPGFDSLQPCFNRHADAHGITHKIPISLI